MKERLILLQKELLKYPGSSVFLAGLWEEENDKLPLVYSCNSKANQVFYILEDREKIITDGIQKSRKIESNPVPLLRTSKRVDSKVLRCEVTNATWTLKVRKNKNAKFNLTLYTQNLEVIRMMMAEHKESISLLIKEMKQNIGK